jgi:hypothetical protein
MINSISSALSQNNVHQSSSTSVTAQKAEPQPQTQTPKSGALSQDQVTLKSAGNVDHDGNKK